MTEAENLEQQIKSSLVRATQIAEDLYKLNGTTVVLLSNSSGYISNLHAGVRISTHKTEVL